MGECIYCLAETENKEWTENECGNCSGTGMGQWDGGICTRCGGTGQAEPSKEYVCENCK
jgi:hypothetical protein